MSGRADRIKSLERKVFSAYDFFRSFSQHGEGEKVVIDKNTAACICRVGYLPMEASEQLGGLRTADKYEAIIEQRIEDEMARRLPLAVGKEIAERYMDEPTRRQLQELVESLQQRLTEADRKICHIRARLNDAADSLEVRAQKMRYL